MRLTMEARPLTRLWQLVLLLCTFSSLARAASTPVATNPILTTVTVTSTISSVITIGTQTSTVTTNECADGTCIAISLVEIPILSTSTRLDSAVITSTVGFTTIFSDVPDQAITTPPPTPANPTPDAAGGNQGLATPAPAVTTTPALDTEPGVSVTVVTISGSTSTIFPSASNSATSTADPASSRTGNGEGAASTSGSGLATRYVIVIAVLAVIVAVALIGLIVFLVLRRKRKAHESAIVEVGSTDSGRHELAADAKVGSEVVEMPAEGYRGTSGPMWMSRFGGGGFARSELPANHRPHEMAGNERYELKA